jgi:hypothetical protein
MLAYGLLCYSIAFPLWALWGLVGIWRRADWVWVTVEEDIEEDLHRAVVIPIRQRQA